MAGVEETHTLSYYYKWGVLALNIESRFWDCQAWSTYICPVLGHKVKPPWA